MGSKTGISWTGRKLGAMKRIAGRVGLDIEAFAARLAAGEKYCWRCRALHLRAAFDVDPSRSDGLNPSCRDSRASAQRAAYTPRPHPRQSKLGTFYAETRNGDRRQARARVNHHVDVGLIPDPNDVPCFDCEHIHMPGERRHEYDHHLGYAAEHQLSVQAVCVTCHHAREKNRRG